MGVVLHLNRLESPYPKIVLCQVWLKLVQWFLIRFLNFVNVFSLFRYYFLLKKGVFFFWMMLLVKLAKWFWRRRWKSEMWLLQRRRTTDKFRSEKFTWAFASGELKYKYPCIHHVSSFNLLRILSSCSFGQKS